MRKKSTWDTLPNEILGLIVNHCGRNCNSVKWMFANKKWFNYYLSQAYHSVNIDLSKQSVKFDQITIYKLNVGRWVKQITFAGFPKVNDITEHYIPGDELGRLMKKTPNVEEVYFSSSQTFDVTDWTYFSVIFLKNNYWKLRVLPKPTNGILHSPVYYICAYHSRHTLRTLHLTLGMISDSDYDCLKEFTALETLHFGKGFVNSFNELDIILRKLTNLKEIIVDFATNRFLAPPKLEDKPYMYPNIKEITFNNFAPKENDELLIFSENFVGLEKLQIVGKKDTPWPSADLDPDVTDVFFDALGDFYSGYQITVEGSVAIDSLLENWENLINRYPREVFLSIEHKRETNYSNTISHPSLTISEDKLSPIVSIYCSIITQPNRLLEDDDARSLIIINSGIVSKIQLSGLNGDNHLIASLNYAFQYNLFSLKTVILIDSELYRSYQSSAAPSETNVSLEGLEFYNCTIDAETFETWSRQFSSLNYMKLTDCFFKTRHRRNSSQSFLNLGSLAVGTMYISNYKTSNSNQNQRSIVSITVYLVDRDIRKYYILMDNHVTDVQPETCRKFATNFKSNEMTTINIQVKSIKKLLLKPIHDGSDFIQIRI